MPSISILDHPTGLMNWNLLMESAMNKRSEDSVAQIQAAGLT